MGTIKPVRDQVGRQFINLEFANSIVLARVKRKTLHGADSSPWTDDEEGLFPKQLPFPWPFRDSVLSSAILPLLSWPVTHLLKEERLLSIIYRDPRV